MAEDDAPKSAYEIAMARLRKQDRDDGVSERSVPDAQKAAIAEVRRVYEAKLAEREILHQSKMKRAPDDGAVAVLEEEYRRDRDHVLAERDRKIEEARRG